MCCLSLQGFQQDNARPHTQGCHRNVSTTLPDFCGLANRTFMRPSGTPTLTAYEFSRSKGSVTANVDRYAGGHHMEHILHAS
ncbi:hypothetical protein GDO78_021368 [Eleutherodactylus coqui]|uniref:Uncharacterized protein n=1 Tax=Eleutherodactylus coqui TaxID=57060 RepID=A0A8J6ECA0_ELECQ|nr:hypothetical protein GDO78_021368 [Eleutherodactylus coqui]